MSYFTPKVQKFSRATLNLYDVHHAVCAKFCANCQTLKIFCQILSNFAHINFEKLSVSGGLLPQALYWGSALGPLWGLPSPSSLRLPLLAYCFRLHCFRPPPS